MARAEPGALYGEALGEVLKGLARDLVAQILAMNVKGWGKAGRMPQRLVDDFIDDAQGELERISKWFGEQSTDDARRGQLIDFLIQEFADETNPINRVNKIKQLQRLRRLLKLGRFAKVLKALEKLDKLKAQLDDAKKILFLDSRSAQIKAFMKSLAKWKKDTTASYEEIMQLAMEGYNDGDSDLVGMLQSIDAFVAAYQLIMELNSERFPFIQVVDWKKSCLWLIQESQRRLMPMTVDGPMPRTEQNRPPEPKAPRGWSPFDI